MYDITYVESKNYSKLVNITKKKWIHGYRTQTNGYQFREWYMGWGMGGTNYCKIGYKDILYNTEEYSHYFVITLNGV